MNFFFYVTYNDSLLIISLKFYEEMLVFISGLHLIKL